MKFISQLFTCGFHLIPDEEDLEAANEQTLGNSSTVEGTRMKSDHQPRKKEEMDEGERGRVPKTGNVN